MTADTQAVGEEADGRRSHLPNASAQKDLILPVHRLPPELLAAIFVHYARDYYHEDLARRYGPLWSVPDWVNVSYVCRRWRAVALGCPTLWSYHFVLSLLWTEELLARSKQASLKICLMVDRKPDQFWWLALLERLMDHSERIQEFHLRFPFQIGTPIPETPVLSRLSFRARRLRSLTIKSAPCRDTEGRSESVDLPSLLLDGGVPAPNLRELELECCPVPWYSFTLSTLTTLRLHDVPLHFRKDMTEFLTILASLQGLTQLYLDRALADTPDPLSDIVYAPSKISLSRSLTRLLVAAPFPTIVTLLSCIDIPLETELRLEFLESTLESLEDYNSLSSPLADKFRASDYVALSLPTVRSLVVHYRNSNCRPGVELIFSSLERDNAPDRVLSCEDSRLDNEWDCGIPLKIFVEIPIMWLVAIPWHDWRDRIASNICRSLPLENVLSVHAVWLHFSLDRWRMIFGHFPGLRHIKVSGGNIRCDTTSTLPNVFFDCVKKQDEDTDQSWNQRRPFVPALMEGLELHGVKLFAQPIFGVEWSQGVQCPDLSLFVGELSKPKTRCKLTMTNCCMGNGPYFKFDLIDIVGWWEDGELKVEEPKVE